MATELKTIKNVEIFRAGKWRGKEYTIKDLEEMVENFHRFKDTWFKPAFKLGHATTPGMEAAGYLDNLRVSGDKLVADIVDIPQEVYEAIKTRRYDRVSIEIVPRWEREGRVYKNVIYSLALLGAEVPEVSGLKPLRALLSSDVEVDSMPAFIEYEDFAVWTTAYINDLPDAAFAVIEPGGKKDEEGKTVPRSLRHFPHHNANVKNPSDNESVDLPHLRNALARLDQANISPELKAKARAHLVAHAKALGVGEYKKNEKMSAEEEPNMDKKTDELKKDKEEPKKDTMSATVPVEIELMQKQLDEATKKIEQMSAQLEEAQARAAKLAEERRKERIEQKVAGLKLPALRTYASVFYNWATQQEAKPVKFSAGAGDKEQEMLPEQIVDQFVAALNKAAESLLTTHSAEPVLQRDDIPAEENPREEVDKRIRQLMAKDSKLDYTTAMRMVFDADPQLKELYARS